MKQGFLKRAAVGLSALALLTLSLAAQALGLGEIRVLSQPGQPLVAEIPIISTEPGELEQLQARLASAETFERVGLARPTGLVGGLDFHVGLSSDDRPVIRVTSEQPVQVDSVNFLIEVDWGQGRLVREYSALVSAPGTIAATAQPSIQAPAPPPSSSIVREPVAAAPVAATRPPPPAPQPGQGVDAQATPAAPPAPAPVAQSATPGDLTVQDGQTLSAIAASLGTGATLDQAMIALLRANPEAFINGNINQLRAGVVLRVPPAGELGQLQEAEAAALVREQNAQWRQARAPIPQPVDATASAAVTAPATAAPAAGPASQARLEIAPPVADAAARAGNQSGTDADGEGDMLANQELTATREDLAARESEVQELRAQVAELEGLQAQQAQLIELKDSELAAAQAQLAGTQGDAGVPVWLWAGLALLVVGLVAAWLLSRRTRPASERAGSYDSAALAAALPAQVPTETHAGADHDGRPGFVSIVPVAAPDDAPELPSTPAFARDTAPAPAVVDEDPAEDARPPWTSPAKPTWHTGSDAGGAERGSGADVQPLNAAPAGRERLELAVAYMDLGDTETARDLLTEVVAGDDPRASEEAGRLLRELG